MYVVKNSAALQLLEHVRATLQSSITEQHVVLARVLLSWLKQAGAACAKMLKYGKHCGEQFEDVVRLDTSYCGWVLREQREGQLSRNYASFAKYIRNRYGGVMSVGRFKGQFYNVVIKDEEYPERTIT